MVFMRCAISRVMTAQHHARDHHQTRPPLIVPSAIFSHMLRKRDSVSVGACPEAAICSIKLGPGLRRGDSAMRDGDVADAYGTGAAFACAIGTRAESP